MDLASPAVSGTPVYANGLTKYIDISDSDIKMYVVTFYCLLYTYKKFGEAAIVRQWNSETTGC